jgi:hypothetical protein
LSAIILRDVFKSAADFNAKKDFVVNSLFPPQIVKISKAAGNSVTFESGAVATLDTDFLDASPRKNLAVWKLKGEIPVTTNMDADPGKLRATKSAKKGGAVGGYSSADAKALSNQLRWGIAVCVENEYAIGLMKRANDPMRGCEDPFIRCSMSLIEHLESEAPDTLNKLLPVLSMGKADFYFLVEPHKDGDHVISNDLIQSWWDNRANHSKSAGCKILRRKLDAAGHGKHLPAIKAVRDQLLPQCVDRNCVEKIEKAYRDYHNGNAEDADLHLLQDELRFLIHCTFEELEASPYNAKDLDEAFNMIADYMFKMSPNAEDRKNGRKVMNANSLKYAIAPVEKLQAISAFVDSSYFLFVSLSEKEANSIPKSRTTKPNPNTKGLWNLHIAAITGYEKHNRVANNSDELEKILESLSPDVAKSIRDALKK